MSETSLQDRIDDATLDFTMGDSAAAIEKLRIILKSNPESFAAWHALTEVYFAESNFDAALEAGEQALALAPEDIHIHTSLSRIWMERGNKEKAEHHGAQARMLGWKEQLNSNTEEDE
ncbi:MAG: tetratricopeptide repeat protein [Opitutales bacterium]